MDYSIKHVSNEQELDAALALTDKIFGNLASDAESPYSRGN